MCIGDMCTGTMVVPEPHRRMDLIDKHPPTVAVHQVGEGMQFLGGEHPAGGVVGVGQHEQRRTRGQRRLQGGQVEARAMREVLFCFLISHRFIVSSGVCSGL